MNSRVLIRFSVKNVVYKILLSTLCCVKKPRDSEAIPAFFALPKTKINYFIYTTPLNEKRISINHGFYYNTIIFIK